jgi:hypothetical protein
MKVMLMPFFTLVLSFAPFGIAAATPLITSVSISAPAESVAVRARRAQESEHLSAHASPARAALMSIGATGIPIATGAAIVANTSHNVLGSAIMIGGVLFGPAAGYYDSGLYRRGTRGMALRTAAGVLSLTVALAAAPRHGGELEDYAASFVIVLSGAAIATTLAVVDCGLVAHDVGAAQRLSFSVMPRIAPSTGAPGVALTVRF